jgi:Family of unknown function (DUF6781)
MRAARRDPGTLSEVLQGLDQALCISTEAGRTALKELTATGRKFSGQDVKAAFSLNA